MVCFDNYCLSETFSLGEFLFGSCPRWFSLFGGVSLSLGLRGVSALLQAQLESLLDERLFKYCPFERALCLTDVCLRMA
jgi:hypothetical protein